MQLAIEKAKTNGIGWVAAKGSNHFGICQWYTEMAMREGLIGMSSTNTSPLVAPTRCLTISLFLLPYSLKKIDSFIPIAREGDPLQI